MSIEKIVKLFAQKRNFAIQETDNGFEIKGSNREWLFYEEEKGVEMLMCGRAFALSGIDESMIYVASSPKEQELIVHVRFGCLRDYISQLSNSYNSVLVDLRQRYQSRLNDDDHAGKWAQETFSRFNQASVYRLLTHFYP